MSDSLLEEANRRAHRLARCAVERQKASNNWQSVTLTQLYDLDAAFIRALNSYEEIEQRMMKEATA